MDYVTRQFINLAKHFRKDLRKVISELSDALHKQTEAIRNATQSDKKNQSPPPVVTVVNDFPSRIEVHQNEKDTNNEINYRRFTFLLSGLTFVAVTIYAVITFNQWRTANQAMTDARGSSNQQYAKLAEQVAALQNANNISIANNRPWIGLIPLQKGEGAEFSLQQGHDETHEFAQVRYLWNFENSGRRPARIEKIRTTAEWIKSCDDNPDYTSPLQHGTKIISPTHVHALIIPNTTFNSSFVIGIPREKWELIKLSQLEFCVYALIEYRDVGGDETVLHHTRECQELITVPSLIGFNQCSNSYANAD